MNNQILNMYQKTIKYHNEDIFIQPLCDFFGINYENQRRMINSDKILMKSSTKKSDVSQFGDNRNRLALTKRGFIRWVQLINVQIVDESLKDKLEEYQNFISDYLYNSSVKEDKSRIVYLYKRKDEIKLQRKQLSTELKDIESSIREINLNTNLSQLYIPFKATIENL